MSTTACGGAAPAHVILDPQAAIEAVQFAPSVAIPPADAMRTPSGVVYKDMTVGTGGIASRNQQITVRYAAYLPNGKLVGGGPGSDQLTLTLSTESVVRGWYDAVPGMRVGGMRRLIVPPSLGYGTSGHGAIPPNAVVVFDVELLAVR